MLWLYMALLSPWEKANPDLSGHGAGAPGRPHCLHTDKNTRTHTPTLHPYLAPALDRSGGLAHIAQTLSEIAVTQFPFLSLPPTYHRTMHVKCSGRKRRIPPSSMKGMASIH